MLAEASSPEAEALETCHLMVVEGAGSGGISGMGCAFWLWIAVSVDRQVATRCAVSWMRSGRPLDASRPRSDSRAACACSAGRAHPVFGLWPVALRHDLRRAMEDEEIRKVDVWTGRHKLVEVEFQPAETAAGPLDPFFNTNRPEDLERAAVYLA